MIKKKIIRTYEEDLALQSLMIEGRTAQSQTQSIPS